VRYMILSGSNRIRFTLHIHLWPIYWLSLVILLKSATQQRKGKCWMQLVKFDYLLFLYGRTELQFAASIIKSLNSDAHISSMHSTCRPVLHKEPALPYKNVSSTLILRTT
jgi:hypothetical protein